MYIFAICRFEIKLHIYKKDTSNFYFKATTTLVVQTFS